MPVFTLIPFPGTANPAVTSLTVDAERDGTMLRLVYRLEGAINKLRIPAPTTPAATEELWKHTCFELFWRAKGADAYHEFNFAPSTAWDHYQFTAPRERDIAAAKSMPTIMVKSSTALLELKTSVQLPKGQIETGLTAVMEDADGGLTYWGLKHPDEKPNFHDPRSFIAKF